MPLFFKNSFRTLAIAILCLAANPSFASHLVGDEFTYKYLGDATISGIIKHHYQVTLNLYEDCLTGNPLAIEQDGPAYFAIYNASGMLLGADSIEYTSSVSVPGVALGACGLGTVPVCLIRKTFIKDYYLESGTSPYTVVYQRCCKNSSLSNITAPSSAGSTYFCTIPPTSLVASNNCAVFNTYPPVQVAINEPFSFDHSATDADGDSLSYELCNTYDGFAGSSIIKPYPPAPPPFDPTTYTYPLTFSNPMHCSVPLSIDPVTGILSGTPNILGRYLIAVCCKEWRAGVLINTSQREFEMMVSSSAITYHPIGGPDTSVYVGDTVQFYASNGVSFSWTPGTYLSSYSIANPVGYFPVAGSFTYVLTGISDSGCSGNDTVTVSVLEHSECRMPNAFTPNGSGRNDLFAPISVLGAQPLGLKVYNRMGAMVYNSNGSTNIGWDGNLHGKRQDMGTYVYILTYLDNEGITRTKKGNVILIR